MLTSADYCWAKALEFTRRAEDATDHEVRDYPSTGCATSGSKRQTIRGFSTAAKRRRRPPPDRPHPSAQLNARSGGILDRFRPPRRARFRARRAPALVPR